jgi:hypothetical protein
MDAFQQRVAQVFAALEQGPPVAASAGVGAAAAMPHQRAQQQQQSVAGIAQTGGWQLDVDQGFKAGRSADESDEEGEGVPQSLPGAAGSDDEEEREYERNASAAFCRCAACRCQPTQRRRLEFAPLIPIGCHGCCSACCLWALTCSDRAHLEVLTHAVHASKWLPLNSHTTHLNTPFLVQNCTLIAHKHP